MGIQDKNNQELGYSNAKVYEARSRSPAKRAERQVQSSFRQSSPPRGGGDRRTSPLRESYKQSYQGQESQQVSYQR